MEIKSVDELCEEIADMVGVYGCCKADDKGCFETNPYCCRTGFVMLMREKIVKAVEFDHSVDVEIRTMSIADWETTDYREQYLKEIIEYKHE